MPSAHSLPPISERVYAVVGDIAAARGIPRLPEAIAKNISVAEVARRLGVARSTVRRPFEDWREMAQNVRWRDGLAIVGDLERLAASGGSAAARFARWWDRVIQPDAVAFLFEEDTIPRFFEDGLIETLLPLLAGGVEQGEFTMHNKADIANMVIHLLRGLALEARSGHEEIARLAHLGDAGVWRRTAKVHLVLLLSLIRDPHQAR